VSGYVAAKAGVMAFVQALDAEYRDQGIRANAVVPSIIDTEANRNAQPDADYSKWVQPAEIASVILFLCSAEASATSGATVPVYGRA
jgi:NAD(P)-dependent dehydrogenase (short-subunit alcohol dehydrogenase family)